MSENHPAACEQDARRESFAAEPTRAACPLVLLRGLKGSWTRAVLKMTSQRSARRTRDLAVLLVIGLAASEDRSPLRASLTERSPDSFRFKPVGGAPSDPGLVFRRVARPAAPDRDQRGGPREP